MAILILMSNLYNESSEFPPTELIAAGLVVLGILVVIWALQPLVEDTGIRIGGSPVTVVTETTNKGLLGCGCLMFLIGICLSTLIIYQQDLIQMVSFKTASTQFPVTSFPTFTSAQSESTNWTWSDSRKGLSGSRFDIFEKVVKCQVPDMTWEYFKEEVVKHNPQLKQDGWVFYPDKTYILPIEEGKSCP